MVYRAWFIRDIGYTEFISWLEIEIWLVKGLPIGSMYGVFTYIWLIFMVNVGEYTVKIDPMGYMNDENKICSKQSQNRRKEKNQNEGP